MRDELLKELEESHPFRRLRQNLKAKNWPLFHPLVTAMIAGLPHSVSLSMGLGLTADEHNCSNIGVFRFDLNPVSEQLFNSYSGVVALFQSFPRLLGDHFVMKHAQRKEWRVWAKSEGGAKRGVLETEKTGVSALANSGLFH